MDFLSTDAIYERQDFRGSGLPKGTYEECTFRSCDLSNVDLAGIIFVSCTFSASNLSLAKLTGTSFRDAVFTDCKMLGLHFEQCSPFALSFRFERCVLNHSSFYQGKLKKTVFIDCQLVEADFTECDLTSAVLHNCDFANATFDRTILEKSDLRTSFNYSIDPEANRIRKARLALPGVLGLLDKYHIDLEK